MAKQRVQVQGVGEAPVVAPVALPGFQYGIAQRKAGTNNLLQLAGNLEQVGLITKGYAGIVQQQQQREQALERGKAAQFKEQQIEEQRRQAEAERRQAEAERQLAKQQRIHEDMLKNHINTDMLPLLQSREGEVLDVEKYTSKAEASQHLDTIIGQARQGVIDLLGEDVANSLPSQLLVNSVIPKWKTTALEKYEKAQDDYTIDQENVQLMETLRAATTGPIDVVNIQAIAEGHEKIMQEKGIDDATDRQRILENGFFATVDTLIAKGRYNDAQSFMNVMELTKVDNRSVFGSSASRLKLNDGIARVRQKMAEVNTQSTAQKREILKGRITSIIRSGVRDREDMPENKLNTLRSIFSSMNPDMQQEEVDQYVDKVFAGGGDVGQNLLDVLDEVGGTEGDLASALYYPILDDITRDYAQIKAIGPTPIAITEETIPQILKDFRSYVKDNPEEDAPWKGFLSDNPRIKKFDELLDESKRLAAGNYVLKKEYYTNIAEQVLANLGAVDNQLKDSEITLDDRSYFYNSGAVSFIKNKVKEEAFRLQDQDEDVRDAALQDLTNELVQKERQRYEGLAKASAITLGDKPAAKIPLEKRVKVTEAEELQKKYKTMFPEAMLEQKRKEIPFFRRDIEADRQKMFTDDDTRPLAVSLTRYGYATFDSESYKMLQKANLDADDVQLFGTLGELNRMSLEFYDVLQKDLERQPLSEEEQKVKETYQGLGIHDVPSLDAFRKTQESNH